MSAARAFAEHLAAQGRFDPSAIAKLVPAVAATKHPLDTLLLELGLVGEEVLADQFATFLDSPLVEDPAELISGELIETIGFDYLAGVDAIPTETEDQDIGLIMADPVLSDAARLVSFLLDRPVTVMCASRRRIAQALEAWHMNTSDDVVSDVLREPADTLEFDDLDHLKDIANDAPVVRLLSEIVQRAIDMKASDIHVEPYDDSVEVRMRCDGVLLQADSISRDMLAGLSTRLKILARLNIAERRIPQDGRLRMAARGRHVDMRLSILPSVHGETLVLRILDRETVPLRLDALGYSDTAAGTLKRLSGLSNGIVLVTGPTGSGKTTTLYAMLNEIDTRHLKVFTVEDPVEYRIKGITQVQINPAVDLDFARTLRTVLRQDPDVILIGEIRDAETAEIAVRAALTGHLVLSTLHTNSAAGAFSRLVDMGVEPYLLADTVRAVIGQRLLRATCSICHGENSADCTACDGTGYRGRVATYEILEVTPDLLKHARFWENEADIVATAADTGYRALAAHAEDLVAAGVTDRRELARVLTSGAP
ncbi:GspE/PulE family protein [Oricola sp.]|uniref:GspE/PulE family protein n=1 Tax=Oricola sp. TaxID=1979950 RepID=UPI0025FB5D17|nr:GspE/PulE family protein [Oricola sp.]MCI5075345.1 GspE/PulE family protein [Oricola sp.]